MSVAEVERPQEPDLELAKRAAAGDGRAFEELYRRHYRRVYALTLRMMGNPTEAEDMTQEVFLQLFNKIGMFRGESQFTTWLHRMTVNQVLMHFRKKSTRSELLTDEGETPVQIVRGTENPGAMPVIDRISLERRSSSSRPATAPSSSSTTSRATSTTRSPRCSASPRAPRSPSSTRRGSS